MIFAFAVVRSPKTRRLIVPCKTKHRRNQPPPTRKPPIGESRTTHERDNFSPFVMTFTWHRNASFFCVRFFSALFSSLSSSFVWWRCGVAEKFIDSITTDCTLLPITGEHVNKMLKIWPDCDFRSQNSLRTKFGAHRPVPTTGGLRIYVDFCFVAIRLGWVELHKFPTCIGILRVMLSI